MKVGGLRLLFVAALHVHVCSSFFVSLSRHPPKNGDGLLGSNAADVEGRRIRLLAGLMRKAGVESDGSIRILTSPVERCQHAGRLVMSALKAEGFGTMPSEPEAREFCSEGSVYSAEAKARVLADGVGLGKARRWYDEFFGTVNELLVTEGLEAVEAPEFSGPNLADLVDGSWALTAIYNARASCDLESFQMPVPKTATHARVHQLLADPGRCSEETLEGLNRAAYAWYMLFHANAREFAPLVYSELLPMIAREVEANTSAALFVKTHDPVVTVLRQALGVNWASVFGGEAAWENFVPFTSTLILEVGGDSMKVSAILPTLPQLASGEEFRLQELTTVPVAEALEGLGCGGGCPSSDLQIPNVRILERGGVRDEVYTV